jgi:outer membrane protein assembly factor BamB
MKQRSSFPNLLAFLLAAAGWLALAVRGTADDWPLVRGDIRGSGVAATPVPDTLGVLWTYQAGQDSGFDATPVVAGGVIYIGDNAGTVHAVRLADGSSVWTKSFDDSGFGAGAAVGNDRLYVGDLNGTLRSLNTADGSQAWKKELEAEVYAGPTLVDGTLLVTTEAGKLYCLDIQDGGERWPPFSIEAPLRCSPTVISQQVVLAGCDAKLHFIDITNGREVATAEIDGPTGATAAMDINRVYFGTEGGTFFAISAPPKQQAASVSTDNEVGSMKPAWTYRDPRRGQPIRSAAAVTDRLIVYGSQGKAIYALDPATGKLKWTQPFATRTRVESSPVIAGSRIVAATTGGLVYLLDAATSEPKWQYEAGGRFTGSPAVVEGRIILGNADGTLYCFGSKGNAKPNIAAENTEGTKANK